MRMARRMAMMRAKWLPQAAPTSAQHVCVLGVSVDLALSDDDEDDEDSEEEDDTAELLRELEKIKRERAEKREREEQERMAAEQEAKERDIAMGNPLLNKPDFNIKRRWDDDVVFKNQARGTEDKGKKEFINVSGSVQENMD